MPPKDKQKAAEAKNRAAKKAKAADDKSFGLKNKNKSKKVQQQISQMKAGTGGLDKRADEMAKRALLEKKAAEAAKAEAAKLFAPVAVQQKVPFGVDPKTIVCEFFKKGICNKGSKCKFAHDLEAGRKVAKKDLYTDARETKEEDTMDKWDEEKLRKVILSKHGNPKTTTDIVCKYFIEAVENGKYGWLWVCPSGGNECKYRHLLPPGFVLKTKEQQRLERLADEAKPKITLEDFIETERDKLPKTTLTPITLDSFVAWKKKNQLKKLHDREAAAKDPKRPLTGREVIEKKFADKFYSEEDASADQGVAWDLSEFTKALKDADSTVPFKDYGDGKSAFQLEQLATAPVAELLA